MPVTDVASLEAFGLAVKAWTAEMGGKLPIRYPRLVQSDDLAACRIYSVLAYADSDMNRVVMCRLFDEDPETIFLHEIGHLLGVPHVQGDALMDGATNGKILRAPTPAAIALAKLAHPAKE
jgi:hypothetical protein